MSALQFRVTSEKIFGICASLDVHRFRLPDTSCVPTAIEPSHSLSQVAFQTLWGRVLGFRGPFWKLLIVNVVKYYPTPLCFPRDIQQIHFWFYKYTEHIWEQRKLLQRGQLHEIADA